MILHLHLCFMHTIILDNQNINDIIYLLYITYRIIMVLNIKKKIALHLLLINV